MEVSILLFSVLREKLERDSLVVSLEPKATGADLLSILGSRYEPIALYRDVIRLAVNTSYVKDEVVLQDGDEVALITPVSGG